MLRIGVLASSIAKSFKDLFTRTTSGNLGDPGNGGVWSAIRGIWSADGSFAVSATAPSSYPIASVDMYSPNVEISATIENKAGTGVSFWVQDSSNWWGAYQFQATNTSYSQACNTYVQVGPSYYCAASQAYNYSYCSVSNPYSYNYCISSSSYSYSYCAQSSSYTYSSCSSPQAFSFSYCTSSNGPFYYSNCAAYIQRYDGLRDLYYTGCNGYVQSGAFYFCNTYASGSGYTCGGWTSAVGYTCNALGTGTGYTCTGGTGTATGYNCGGTSQGTGYTCTNTVGPNYGASCNSYYQASSQSAGQRYFRFIKSVANTVTTVVDQSISSTISSIKVILSGNTITAKIYSDAAQTSQIAADIVSSQDSPQTGTKHGLLLAPGGWEQGTKIDDISIKI